MWLISYSISLDLIKPGRAEQFNIGFITMKMSRGALACGLSARRMDSLACAWRSISHPRAARDFMASVTGFLSAW
jgi:hypothetical protein